MRSAALFACDGERPSSEEMTTTQQLCVYGMPSTVLCINFTMLSLSSSFSRVSTSRRWLARRRYRQLVTYAGVCLLTCYFLFIIFMTFIIHTTKLPDKSVKLFHKPYSTKAKAAAGHAIHVCERFKYLMHVDVLPDDSLVVVERPLDAILQSLPEPLLRKKFGV